MHEQEYNSTTLRPKVCAGVAQALRGRCAGIVRVLPLWWSLEPVNSINEMMQE
jgi:hypothetical protein